MSQAWPSIVDIYRQQPPAVCGDVDFWRAAQGIGQLALHISETSLGQALFGWTSMLDLCIQQTDAPPYSVPYLRVSPLRSGNVEFRYIDTPISARQWQREVSAEDTVPRLIRFLDQLRWVGQPVRR